METWQGNPDFIPAGPAAARPPSLPQALSANETPAVPMPLAVPPKSSSPALTAPTAAAVAVAGTASPPDLSRLPPRPSRLDNTDTEPSLSTLTRALHNLKATYAPIPPVHPPQPPTPAVPRRKFNLRKEKRLANKFFNTYLADAPPETATSHHNNIAATLVASLRSAQAPNHPDNSNTRLNASSSSTEAANSTMNSVPPGLGAAAQSRPGGPVRQPSQTARRPDHPYRDSIPPRFDEDRRTLPFYGGPWNMPPPIHYPNFYQGLYPNTGGSGYGQGMFVPSYGPEFGYGDSEIYGEDDAYGGDYSLGQGN
ncbi:hypothetical protein CC2G_015238 [Coprinopsis cinerea AmutBmut pab1-1]|nr:hypothetical protein CC2G_015238 [Coprinopsis cinerea AmutBmut pab1-1]